MSKIDAIKERCPYMTIDLVELFSRHDQTPTKKYLEYMVKVSKDFIINELNPQMEEVFSDLFSAIDEFDKYKDYSIIKNKDIYAYTLEELTDAVKEARKYKTEAMIKETETIKIFENDNIMVIIPLTKASSLLYGANTKWCTASKTSEQFQNYVSHGVLVYVINNNKGTKEIADKLAFYLDHNASVSFALSSSDSSSLTLWDSADMKTVDVLKIYQLLNNVITPEVTNLIMEILNVCREKKYTIEKHARQLKSLVADLTKTN